MMCYNYDTLYKAIVLRENSESACTNYRSCYYTTSGVQERTVTKLKYCPYKEASVDSKNLASSSSDSIGAAKEEINMSGILFIISIVLLILLCVTMCFCFIQMK